MVSYAHKNDVVNEYETQLARYATAHGLRAEVLFPTSEWLDATLHNWRKLLRAGFPYLKVGTARALVPGVETADWRAEMVSRGYDTGPADRTLARLARNGAGSLPAPNGASINADRLALAEMHEFLADGDKLDLSLNVAPSVSFLVVLNGRPAQFLRLARVLAEGQNVATDVVIIDNASIDDTYHVLGRLTGATIVTNVAPLPLLRAARQALARARADILFLLLPGEWRTYESNVSTLGGAQDEKVFRDMLGSIWPADDGLTYDALATPVEAPWRAFSLLHHGDRLGTVYAMLRRDAPQALEWLVGLLEPLQCSEIPDPNVL